MIDYFVIVYLIKRFGFDQKYDRKKYKYFKLALFFMLIAISLIRLIWFPFDLMGIYIGPFYYIGNLEMFGLLVITVFFYAGMLLLPFALIFLYQWEFS